MAVDPIRVRQIVMLAAISVMIVCSIATLGIQPSLLVYNASGSMPHGFYRIEDRLPGRGDIALVRPASGVDVILTSYNILPPNALLLKPVAAMGGDEVCRSNAPAGIVSINGKAVAETLAKDDIGRPLPVWDGCIRLIGGEYFLLALHPRSFDSRYFGPILRCDVLGVARPVWTWNPPD